MLNQTSAQNRIFDTKLWHVVAMAMAVGFNLAGTWNNYFWLHQSLRGELIIDALGAALLGLFVWNYRRVQASRD